MSGLFGYFSSTPNREKILNLAKTMKYSIKEAKASEVCLVCNLDIKSRYQDPIDADHETDGFLVFCGEFYNEDIVEPKKYLREVCETEDFEKLKKINGSFLFAFYDNKKEKLTLINDRFGSKKLFYFYQNNQCYFSPKIAPLMDLVTNKKIRKDALLDFFIFGYYLGDKTFDENIHQLPAASILEITKNGSSIKNYWTYLQNGKFDSRDIEALTVELGRIWQNAVDRRIKKDDKIIVEISGGLDSRAILAAALQRTKKENILLYTFGEEKSYDSEIGKLIAKTLGIHHVLLPAIKENFAEQYEKSFHDIEGMIDATPYFAIQMDQRLLPQGSPIYNGFMGGEIMGPLIFSKIDELNPKSAPEYVQAKEIFLNHHKFNDERVIKNLFNPSFMNGVDVLSSFEKSIEDLKNISSVEFPNYCAKWLYVNEADKYTSFCNFRYETIFSYCKPFLDNDLVEFMLHVPMELRKGKKLYKKMLMKRYPDLFRLPTKNNLGLPLEPNDIWLYVKRVFWFLRLKLNKISNSVFRKNLFFNKYQNFIDYDELFRTNMQYQTFMKSMIDKVKKRDLFNPSFIDSLWESHLGGKKNFAMIFGLLVTVEYILEEFYD